MPKLDGTGRLDGRVLRGRLLDGPGDKLLHLLGGRARPLALRRRHAHRNVRVLALGHVLVAEPAPDEGREQQDHRDLPVLGKEPRGVVRGRDDLGVGFVVRATLRDVESSSRHHLEKVLNGPPTVRDSASAA